MNLSIAGMIANTSLGTISNEISILSRNVSNANTPGYSTRVAQTSTGAGGAAEVNGVARITNPALFKSQLQSTSGGAQASAVYDGLSAIAQLLTTDGDGNSSSPSSLIGKLSSALQSYDAAPSNPTAAAGAVTAAKDLANSLNQATTTVQDVRRNADRQIEDSVTNINSILSKFEQVNNAIVAGTGAKRDVTDLLDQRDSLLTQLSSEIGITTVTRPNNDMMIFTDSGVTLFETAPRAVTFQRNPALTAGASGNAVYVDGVQVTGNSTFATSVHSGKLAGLTQLRDSIAPAYQNQLDEIARGLVSAFSESDQTGGGAPTLPGLFTYPGATSIPGALVSGLAGQIQVNANADPSQGGDPTRLRDGGISDPGNPAYTYNTSGGALYTARIEQMISSLSATQSFDPAAGLNTNTSLTAFASASDGWLSAQKQQAHSADTYQSAMLNQSVQALSNAVGVNLDSQMAKMLELENSYQATAKLISSIDALYTALFNAIRP
ncbi:flagellar hook-associated protein FlgK [Methylocystis iwaonis]|uniref:flagellar hook-associated protein FlgK n=1 Tax=Methylocystis iwaonis TaxID=2885079 RepID=UPI002E7C1E52|nr:flagellar hook-associated protein FlgK [Methylocystis iwaonis]